MKAKIELMAGAHACSTIMDNISLRHCSLSMLLTTTTHNATLSHCLILHLEHFLRQIEHRESTHAHTLTSTCIINLLSAD